MPSDRPSSVNIPLAGEKTPRVRTPRRRPPRRRIILLCLSVCIAAAALCLLIFFGSSTGDSPAVRPSGNATIELVVTRPETTRPFAGGLLALSGAGYTWYNDKGSSAGFVSAPMQDPVLLCSGSRFLCYSRGGKNLYYSDASAKPTSLTVEGNIISADFNAKHQIALVTDAEYHKGEASVYLTNGTRAFSYRSGEAYPYLCALSDDGSYLALAVLLSDSDGNAATALYCFSTKSDSIAGTLSFPDEVIRFIDFHSAKGITLITDTAVIRTDEKGTELSRFRLPVGNILHYALCGDTVILCTNRREAGYRFDLIAVSAEGQELARLSTNTDYTAIAADDAHVALLSAAGAEVYDRELQCILTRSEAAGITGIAFADDGRLCCITPGGVTLTALR